jgi:uncharacterized alpha-E superfamily protein
MLLCRLAENAYWFGRHAERTEDLARALLAYEDIRLDMPGQRAPGWQQLATLAGVSEAASASLDSEAFVAAAILDRENPSSLLGALHAAREDLRRARPLFPAEGWHTLNPIYLRLCGTDSRVAPAQLRELLERAVAACRELAGHIEAGMLRDDAHAFLRMGLHLERADLTLRIVALVADTLMPPRQSAPFEDVRWIGLLKCVGAYGSYRHRYQTRSNFVDALELLFGDPAFPRSLVYTLREIGRDLTLLPGNASALAALKQCRPARPARTRADLRAFADEEIDRLAGLHAAIDARYFRSDGAGATVLPHAPVLRAASAERDQPVPLPPPV